MNESAFYPRFEKIFHLYLTPETLIARNSQRKAGGHTNNPAKQERMLEFLKHSKKYALGLGMIVIDTSNSSPEESANEILGYINEN
jgi:regulator of PEP synthase PpsR (kinase-PPPase family)